MCVTFLGFCVRGGMCVRVHVFDWEEGLSSALRCVPLKNNSRIYLGSEFKMSRNIKDQENLRHSYKKVCTSRGSEDLHVPTAEIFDCNGFKRISR